MSEGHVKPSGRTALLIVLGFLSFAAVYNGLVMSPVLESIAREFGISTGTAGLVVAAYGAPGIAVAVLAGPYSDRIGRKPFLVIGPFVMGVATLVASFVPTFALIVAARICSGIGSAVIFPNVNATVADTFPFRERGKALAAVIGMNTMASVAGVPIAGILAEATSWRVSVGLVGVLSIVASAVLFVRLPHAQGTNRETRIRALYALILGDRSAVAAITSSFLGALFWFTWATYIVVFFQRVFGLSEGLAATVALTQGLGVLIGSQIGGRLGDRIGHRRIVAGSVVISGFLLFLQTNLGLPLVATALINLVLSGVIGARFATNNALMTEQVPEARGTMLALSASVASIAIVVGATVGGLMVDGPGFGALGAFCFAVACGSAAIVLRFVREEPMDLEVQPLR
ncbi:MAG TPA: MFS transporter [Candidatus Limnocylindria bacterium]|nr:MFS transporter [Candidatus Limnocylindria bacterium]